MQRHRFYAPPSSFTEASVRLDADEARHLTRALRLGPGARVFVFDGEGAEYECDVERVAKHGRLAVGHLGPVHDEAHAFVSEEPHELRDAQEVLARPLEVLEVVRVVDRARVIGVLVVDLDGVNVGHHAGVTITRPRGAR